MLRFGSHRFGSNRATHLKSPKKDFRLTAVWCISSQEWKHPRKNKWHLISGHKWQNTCSFLKAGVPGFDSGVGTRLKTLTLEHKNERHLRLCRVSRRNRNFQIFVGIWILTTLEASDLEAWANRTPRGTGTRSRPIQFLSGQKASRLCNVPATTNSTACTIWLTHT